VLAAVGVAGVGFAAWFLRPEVQTLHGDAYGTIRALQSIEGQPIDMTRTYYEFSMQWMWWYIGYVSLAAAILGAAFLVRGLILGKTLHVFAPLCVLVPASFLYLYKASAVSDHIWVTRRFLIGALPTLVLLAFGFAAGLWSMRASGALATLGRIAAVIIVVFGIGHPIYTVSGVAEMTEQRGYLNVIHEACDGMGDDAAVVLIERDNSDLFDDWVPQALRGWCGAKVAMTRGQANPVALRRLATNWNAAGRKFYVAATTPEVIREVLPDAEIVTTSLAGNDKFLRQALTHRPNEYQSQSFQMSFAPVPPG
jgi:hypothetical protein